MVLDPQVQAFLQQQAEQLAENPVPPIAEQTPEMARAGYLALAEALGDGPAVETVKDLELPGPAGDLPARLYRPNSPEGLLVYYHGGGWVIGDLDTHDYACRELALGAGCSVLSIDYRLAPEHPYPAAVEDAWAALVWAADNAEQLASPGSRVAVGGDSAGGNLAAVVAILSRDRSGPELAFQLLIYPAVDMRMGHPSIDENAEGYVLTRDHMLWFRGHYLRGGDDSALPTVSPLLAESHAGLPPALILTAEYDPLRDEGKAYADKLRAAGVATTHSLYDGQVHVFFQLSLMLDGGRAAVDEACAALRASLRA